MKGSSSDSEEKENLEAVAKTVPYLIEDLVRTAEEARKKLENYENPVDSSHHPTSNPPLPLSQNSAKVDNRINQLKTEMGQIQQEIGKLGTNSTGDENKFKKRELEQALAALKHELESLRKIKAFSPQSQGNQSENKNNNKLNWAIGLGIGAIVIGLVCLILIASRRKEN